MSFGSPLGISGDLDAVGAAAASLRNRDREQSILELGRHMLRIGRFGQDEGSREASVSALDAVILLAGYRAAAFTADHDPAFFGVDLDFAALEARKFGG